VTAAPGIVQVGLDHRGASLEALAELYRRRAARGPGGAALPGTGRVELATCHRLELYLEGVSPQEAPALFLAHVGVEQAETGPSVGEPTLRVGEEAARHLLRVAAGLESAVLGEDQVLMQVRQAYRAACRGRSAGPLLHRLFHASFRAGKRVRAETSLAKGFRSLAGAAVGALQRSLGGLRGRTVLVLGTGEMGSLAARRLRRRGVGHLILSNRSPKRAASLAARLDAETVRWEWREGVLARAEGIVCATGAPEPVLGAKLLERAAEGRERPLVVVDLAVPRNVESPRDGARGLVHLDVEGLGRLLEEEARRRRQAVRQAEALVEDELAAWAAWADERSGASRKGPSRGCRRDRAAG
jgi:glutamyl-tRNA reductase